MGRRKSNETALKTGDYVMCMYVGTCKVKAVYADGLLLLERGSYWGGVTQFKEYANRCIRLTGFPVQILEKMYSGKNLKLL